MTAGASSLRDTLSGAALVLVGGGAMAKAWTGLHIGSLANMGPGFFPMVLGACLLLSGLWMLLTNGWRLAALGAGSGSGPRRVNLRAVGLVGLAVMLFALMVQPVGLIPAAFVLVTVAAVADPRTRLKTAMILAAGLSVVSWLIFVAALGMPLSAFSF